MDRKTKLKRGRICPVDAVRETQKNEIGRNGLGSAHNSRLGESHNEKSNRGTTCRTETGSVILTATRSQQPSSQNQGPVRRLATDEPGKPGAQNQKMDRHDKSERQPKTQWKTSRTPAHRSAEWTTE
jgi:hypothetical protein